MDRNQFIGLILMLVLITVYFQFFAPEVPVPQEVDNQVAQPIIQDSLANPTATSSPDASILSDSAIDKLNQMKYGLFSLAAQGTDEELLVENESMKISFSSKGGQVSTVELKNYKKFNGEPLVLITKEHNINVYFEHLSRRISLNDLYFTPSVKKYQDSTQIIYTLAVNGAELKQVFTLPAKGYTLGYRLVSNGFEKQIDAKNLNLLWSARLPVLEEDLRDSRSRTTVRYYDINGDMDYLKKTSNDHEEETLTTPLKWVSFNQKFFSSAIISEKGFPSAFITMDVPIDSNAVKYTTMQLEIPYTDLSNNQASYAYYFGPNDYNELKEVTDNFSANIELGWFFLPLINKFLIIPIFNFLEKFIPNYGLIIIIMVLVIRLLISPLTYTSHISMAKMRVLKPELDDIKARLGDDQQKIQTEQMDLYRKVGINPLSGCIPVLLQFPILVSLFYFIPSAIELRLVPFLWAHDMSTYDSILNLPFTIPFYGDHVSLFTLLMAGSTILYTMANAQVSTMQGPMKTMQYIMPVMLLFFFNSYPSGLSFYYFVTNLVSFGQIAMFRKFIDEDKIKRILEENKKKNANKKKSKFQARLEDAMKASQEAQKKNKNK